MSALAERLHGILNRPQPSPFLSPDDPRGWLELAYDRAYAEDHDGAVSAAEAGIAAEGADPEAQLSLWGVAASVHHLAERDDAALECAHRRVELLRRLGRDHQADLEQDLGSLLFREPRPEEAPLLEAALATHSAAGASAAVLADIRLPLAVCRVEAGDGTALETAGAVRGGLPRRRTHGKPGRSAALPGPPLRPCRPLPGGPGKVGGTAGASGEPGHACGRVDGACHRPQRTGQSPGGRRQCRRGAGPVRGGGGAARGGLRLGPGGQPRLPGRGPGGRRARVAHRGPAGRTRRVR